MMIIILQQCFRNDLQQDGWNLSLHSTGRTEEDTTVMIVDAPVPEYKPEVLSIEPLCCTALRSREWGTGRSQWPSGQGTHSNRAGDMDVSLFKVLRTVR